MLLVLATYQLVECEDDKDAEDLRQQALQACLHAAAQEGNEDCVLGVSMLRLPELA